MTKEKQDKAPVAVEQNKEVVEPAQEEVRVAQPSAADLLSEEIGEVKIRKVRGKKPVPVGICSILATFNNTKVCFTDPHGNVITWSSAGKCNFRGSRKSTAYAAQVVTQDAGRRAQARGMKDVKVRVAGGGLGRDSAIRALAALGYNVTEIIDETPMPHNGCRPPKARRV